MSGPASNATIWFDPGFGVSGDMMLGVLIGLGADPDAIASMLKEVVGDIDGWSITSTTATRASLDATRVTVTHAHEPHTHRSWSEIEARLAKAELDPFVSVGARRTFRILAEAEALIHRVNIDEVHFHEVGAVDAMIDIVGSWLALHHLVTSHSTPVTRVVSGPVGVGRGTVPAAHGVLPVPAPATAALLAGRPITGTDIDGETATPTGAALLVAMADAWGAMPDGLLLATARGAGGRDPGTHPNVLTAHLIDGSAIDPEPVGGEAAGIERQHRVVLSTNLDDVTAEVVAHVVALCLESGADDAWTTPITMKKGRAGTELNVLCPPGDADRLRRLVMAETGTLGVRTMPVTRDVSARHYETVTVRGESITIKIGLFGAKPEYDDLVVASRRLGVPLRRLSVEAMDRWHLSREGTSVRPTDDHE